MLASKLLKVTMLRVGQKRITRQTLPGLMDRFRRDESVRDLRIDAVTEDGAPVSCPLAAAFDEKGNSIAVVGNRITGVSIPSDGTLRLRIILKQPMRVALRASTL